ncbi:hypothetical protein [Cerasicoccus fimbriatus]|uniref:hypothetical protein n=1 Tax=Cerasicoccus fimbriatus TaxID=3014554 RepID=UPI0022B5D8C6|nr:hypothetical protein [Cerasicoccus sp. TK19100]
MANIQKNSHEGQLLSFFWITIAKNNTSIEGYTKWTLSGVAAMIAIILSNTPAIIELAGTASLKWSISLLVFSLMFGFGAHISCLSIGARVRSLESIQAGLQSQQGQISLNNISISPQELGEELISPFWGPLKSTMKKNYLKGLSDPFLSEKGMINVFCIQVYLTFLHLLIAAIALFVLVI